MIEQNLSKKSRFSSTKTLTGHGPLQTKTVDRMHRIGDAMHRAIARLIREEFKDPRIGMVTVASVEVSRDLAHAKVFVTVFEEAKVTETLAVLNAASGFFRRQLASMMHLRLVPKPRFIFDGSVKTGTRIAQLLAQEPCLAVSSATCLSKPDLI